MRRVLCSLLALCCLVAAPVLAAQVQVLLPLGRTAYQTNELIDLSVVRGDAAALAADTLQLAVTGDDGSKMTFSFPVAAVPVAGADARATEHLHLNGNLLRPGNYTAQVTVNGATNSTKFEVYSNIRKSSYKIIDWGSGAKGADIVKLGEDGMGFNLLYASAGGDDSIRGGMDYMGCCIMSGGHQMDLRPECDWSDPYVLSGGKARVVRAALQFRTSPNAIGVHFYDEPGLTWVKHAKTGETVPFNIPSQDRSYKSAFGVDSPQYNNVKPEDAKTVADWKQLGTWKLGFMNAAWKDSQFGVSYVKPEFLSVTQSQYGCSAFTDGYYFNVVHSLPVTSGHGGYDEWGGYLNPVFTLEFARARDLSKPDWYLPDWDNIPSERFRLEQYTCFMLGLQGLAKPPSVGVHNPASTITADGVVESNKTALKLGTIFTTMPAPRSPVVELYSLSHLLDAQTKKMSVYYSHQDQHGVSLTNIMHAGLLDQQRIQVITDEDVIDGTAALYHKVIILPSINYLDPKVLKGLADFIAGGGKVYMTSDSQVKVPGAINLGVTSSIPDADLIKQLNAQGRTKEADPKNFTTGKEFLAVQPFAKALKAQLAKDGIAPVFECNNQEIAASRAAYGDIEYIFAVNVKYNEAEGEMDSTKATTATIGLPDDGRPLYDAMIGGPAQGFVKKGNLLSADFRWGIGEMRAYARTARPIGGVKVAVPLVTRDLTLDKDPIKLNISATLVDTQNGILAGSAPLQIQVVDPLGATRYDLYRATDQGLCRLSLPLAANDPTGTWTVTVTELLSNKASTATFSYAAPARCAALAGATSRAVIFGNDREQCFRFFRTHQDVTIVTGTSPFNADAAERLAASLKPWKVRCRIITAAEVNKAREVSAEEAPTLCGIDYAGGGQIKAGRGNPANLVGYDVQGPVVLLGNPQDNPLIENMIDHLPQHPKVLPYAVTPDFPGRGHGLLAWQLDIVGPGQESITCIANDAAGMAEAIGTLYEAVAGLDPLTPLALPQDATIAAANKPANLPPAATVAWEVLLPDRVATMSLASAGDLKVTTIDGSASTISAGGKLTGTTPLTTPVAVKQTTPPALPANCKPLPARVAKAVAAGDGLNAVGYWGGTLQIVAADGTVKAQQMLPQDITAMAWQGTTLAVGLADGRVLGLTVK